MRAATGEAEPLMKGQLAHWLLLLFSLLIPAGVAMTLTGQALSSQ